jgi:nucleoid DNA-binding protein
MKKHEIIKKIADKLNYKSDVVTKVYDETIAIIVEELKEKKKVFIPSLGTLLFTKTTPRKYVLPNGKTGKSKAKKTLKFKPSTKLLEKL